MGAGNGGFVGLDEDDDWSAVRALLLHLLTSVSHFGFSLFKNQKSLASCNGSSRTVRQRLAHIKWHDANQFPRIPRTLCLDYIRCYTLLSISCIYFYPLCPFDAMVCGSTFLIPQRAFYVQWRLDITGLHSISARPDDDHHNLVKLHDIYIYISLSSCWSFGSGYWPLYQIFPFNRACSGLCFHPSSLSYFPSSSHFYNKALVQAGFAKGKPRRRLSAATTQGIPTALLHILQVLFRLLFILLCAFISCALWSVHHQPLQSCGLGGAGRSTTLI